ncbi:H-NS histone family protein [Yoonia sp. 208BN28-4]|uniref:H-NS histone family protein n=1 Tax=Yoonia sp. 208BN28-4 TaxID=3126505 RepID=UPI0030B758AD
MIRPQRLQNRLFLSLLPDFEYFYALLSRWRDPPGNTTLEEIRMKFDLKSMSRKELEKLKVDIDKALVKVTQKEMKAARDAAAKAAAAHGFSLADLASDMPVAKAAKKTPKTKSPPRFANPADSAQTWTGKGRQPDWFKSAIKAGQSPDDLAI